ncbi:MAG: 50S ribosomal protein L18 [Nitrospirae bacterium]|nr:50S ribosomal protein L18 [Candidatus Manganitrophaceae bacterium]
MQSSKDKVEAKRRRHYRVRLKVAGSAERPRLSVYRSLKHIYAQIIDDTSGRTLVSTSSLGGSGQGNVQAASEVGKKLAEVAKSANIERVVFDRGGCLYHGRVKALAESAREGGLLF